MMAGSKNINCHGRRESKWKTADCTVILNAVKNLIKIIYEIVINALIKILRFTLRNSWSMDRRLPQIDTIEKKAGHPKGRPAF